MSQTLENLAGYTQVSTFGISEAHDENFYFDIGDYCKVKVNFIDILYFHDIHTVLCENWSQVLFLYMTTVEEF